MTSFPNWRCILKIARTFATAGGGVGRQKSVRLRRASLVQLITGLVFEGPQLIAQINRGLPYLLIRDGFSRLREAVGADANLI